MKMATAVAVACLSVVGLAAGQDAQAVARHYDLNIPKQSLDTALRDLAQQTGLQIALFSDSIDGNAVAGPILGNKSAEEALKILLTPSGLSYKVVSEGTIAVLNPRDTPPAVSAPSEEEKKRSFLDRFRISQATSASTAQGAAANEDAKIAPPSSEKDSGAKVQEIVVTAQKRVERLQDVPVPVTAISGQQLVDSNQLRLQDYYARVPGLSYTAGARGEPYLIIRGLSTSPSANPTVGITVDDIPYGGSSLLTGGSTPPDLDPSDLSRIEVLRGPQGTLYGASSIGGLVKFVTIDPSVEALSGAVQGTLSDVTNGADIGYAVRASVNIPLGDTAAVRASGFRRRDPGYVDNVQTGEQSINQVNTDGGRFVALWKASDNLSLKLSAHFQEQKADGLSQVDAGADLQQSRLRGSGQYDRRSQIYAANLTARLRGVNVTSVTAYDIDKFFTNTDYTGLLGAVYGVRGLVITDDRRTSKFSQEVRFSSSLGSRIDWLLGGFYTFEDTYWNNDVLSVDSGTGSTVNRLFILHFPNKFRERAGFADLTYRFTDAFDVQIGGRESWITYISEPSESQLSRHDDASAFTYLLTPRYRLSPDFMVYARFASGYRAGGSNINLAPGVPAQYDPDKSQNYEIGLKGNLGPVFSFDASMYYINWRDIQLTSISSTRTAYRSNGGKAKSQGIELSIESRPVNGLTAAISAAFNDADLTEDLPISSTVRGRAGSRLPFSSRFSGSISLDKVFSVTARVAGDIGATATYVGDRQGAFGGTLTRDKYPGYTNVDLRGGIKWNLWKANLFINNVADKRGVLMKGLSNSVGLPAYSLYTQPRTYGISLSRNF